MNTSKGKYNEWLLVSDIDGTLNNTMRKTPANNIEAIKRFTSNGGNFTLASGRNLQSLTPHFKKLGGIKTPAIILNGAGIYSFEQEKMLCFSPIADKGIAFIFEMAERFPSAELVIFTDELVYPVKPRAFGRIMPMVDKLDHKDCQSLFEVPRENWGKATFFAPPTMIGKMKEYLAEHGRGIVDTLPTSGYTLELLNAGVNKGTAVMALAQLLGVQPSRTAAIGDYYNDADMLKAVALPACCRQAPAPIKALVKYCTCHANKGAVSDFITYIEKNYIY